MPFLLALLPVVVCVLPATRIVVVVVVDKVAAAAAVARLLLLPQIVSLKAQDEYVVRCTMIKVAVIANERPTQFYM